MPSRPKENLVTRLKKLSDDFLHIKWESNGRAVYDEDAVIDAFAEAAAALEAAQKKIKKLESEMKALRKAADPSPEKSSKSLKSKFKEPSTMSVSPSYTVDTPQGKQKFVVLGKTQVTKVPKNFGKNS